MGGIASRTMNTSHDNSKRQQAAAEHPAAADSGRAQAAASLPERLIEELNQGRCLSNTAPQSIQEVMPNYPEYRFAGGLDWLEWSIAVQWPADVYQELFSELEEVRQECQDSKVPEKLHYLYGSLPVFVHRMGKTRGGARGRHYPFVITLGGIQCLIGNWQPSEGLPDNFVVCLTGRDCLLRGAWQCRELVHAAITKFGGEPVGEKVSRVDFCLDIDGLSTRLLQELVESRHYISRFKEVCPHSNLVDDSKTGFTAGKRPQRLIVYDKIEQVRRKYDREYVHALIQYRYGGNCPGQATRVEIQLGREVLRKFGIGQPADIPLHGPSALRRILTEGFRVVDRPIPPGTKNHSRAEIHPLWTSIIEAFEKCFGEPGPPPPPLDRSEMSPDQLIKQGFGCFRNAALQKRIPIARFSDFLTVCSKLIREVFDSDEKQEEFVEKYQFGLTEHTQ